jgi:hypothetical protein
LRTETFREVLGSLAARLPPVVREYEILRISGTVVGNDTKSCADLARDEVLKWAQRRCGGKLPNDAWDYSGFEFFSGGRDTLGVRIRTDTSDIWAVRADDPDKSVPGRVWTNEIAIALTPDQLTRFTVRQLVSTSEDELDVEPHSPGFVRQIAENCGLMSGAYSLDAEPWVISTDQQAQQLIQRLIDPNRPLPIFVLSVPDDSPDPFAPLVDANALAQATIGLAQVAVLRSAYTWLLTERFDRKRSVFGGAVRAYLPGFTENANPYEHRLILAAQVGTRIGAAQALRWMRSIAAKDSLGRSRLGKDVVPFSTIRNAGLELKQRTLIEQGATAGDVLATATDRIKALEQQINEEKAAQDFYVSEHDKAVERAAAAEEQHRASAYRIQELLDQLQVSGQAQLTRTELPSNWEDFANWADVALAGKLVLTPNARRQTRSPQFENVDLAARCLTWLGSVCRKRRLDGGGELQDQIVEEGVRNAHCGSDEFDFDWQGLRYTADWHIKSGGNTRDPKRCLRIYYGWDESTRQILIADMPGHRRTEAS